MGSGSSSSASAQKYDATRASHRFDKTSIRDLAGATWTAAHDVRFEACADDEGTVSKEELDRILVGISTWHSARIVEVEDEDAAKQVRVRRQSAQQDMLGTMRGKKSMLKAPAPAAASNKALAHATSVRDMENVVHAVIRAQRGFRRFYATLEARRRRAWKIYQEHQAARGGLPADGCRRLRRALNGRVHASV